jgi:hypothetical protein
VEIWENLWREYIPGSEARECAVAINMRSRSSISMQACSACAGDYEDPDRTAGEEFEDLLGGDDEYEWQGDEEERDVLDGLDVGVGE